VKIVLDGIHWHYLSEAGRAWLTEVRHESLVGEPVKSSYNRSVVRLAEGIYIKQVHYRGLHAILKTVVGGNAAKAGKINIALSKRGVSVPQVLAFGTDRSFGLIRRDLLITRELLHGTNFADFIRTDYPELDPCAKQRLVKEFAEFIKGLHAAGVFHRDLHYGNIFIFRRNQKNRFVLLDLDQVRLKPQELSPREKAQNLAILVSNFWTLSRLSERFRFLKYYDPCGQGTVKREFTRRITQIALKKSHRVWQSKARRCLFNNTRFRRQGHDRFKIFSIRRSDIQDMLHDFLSDPEQLMQQGLTLKNGRTVKAVKVKIKGRFYFLKRYNCKGWVYRIKNAFRRSRAKRTWYVNWGLRVRDLPVPKPLICLEERHFRLLGRSYILSEYFDGAKPLSLVWKALDDRRKKRLITRLAMILGRMHRMGVYHGDLKWNNVLIREHADEVEIVICDLDSARIFRRLDDQKAFADLRRFLKDLQKWGADRAYQMTLIDHWQKWSGCRKPTHK
jgi:serine/threonine protein kinase